MEISFKTDSKEGSWKIPSRSVLESFKLSPEDVENVELAYNALSNYPYEEVNVARCSHPCEGSIGIYINTNDGRHFLSEEIFYYDYNLGQTHFDGLPHWNHERRLTDGTRTWYQKKEEVEYHAIPDSPIIALRITDVDSVIHEKEIKRVPIEKVRKQK
jgi:hypothetical protein